MSVSRRQVAMHAAKELATGVNVTKVAQQLAAYIVDTKSSRTVELLVRDIELCLHESFGHSVIHISSAHEITGQLQKAIVAQLGLNTKQVEIEASIDGQLIGGIVVGSAGKEFDGSIKRSLKTVASLAN